jgi:hypothetical protein
MERQTPRKGPELLAQDFGVFLKSAIRTSTADGETNEHHREPAVGHELTLAQRIIGKNVRVADHHGVFETAKEPMPLVDSRIQVRRRGCLISRPIRALPKH